MNSISVAAAACLQSFPKLASTLQDPEHCRTMPQERLEREFDRFKIWCGNLGALRTGSSSLDFRLRDSTVVRTNVLKLLGRLEQILSLSIEVATGARLPFEKDAEPEDSESPNKQSEEEDEEDEEDEEPLTELGLHMSVITEILGDLYKLSFRIRNSATRPRPLKSLLYKEVDEETGVDKFATYADFDKRHVQESVSQLRKEAAERMDMDPSKAATTLEEDAVLIDRLAATLTERRKILRYWQRHAKKLGTGPIQSSSVAVPNSNGQALGAQPSVEGPQGVQGAPAPSVTANTVLSGTVATEYDRKLDNMLDAQSVISYASTSFDVQGKVVDLPPPPAIASSQTEFLCPYCGIVYPSSYGKSRAWKAHVLQDLQPYVCTYPDCHDGLQLYSTRHAWLEHERLVHRRVWQCFEHETVVFRSKFDLRCHLESQHNDDVTKAQVENLLDVSESSLADTRQKCPICLIGRQFFESLGKHISFHLETLATFSVSSGIPIGDEEDSPGADNLSGIAQAPGSVYSTPSEVLHSESSAQSIADSAKNVMPIKGPPLSDNEEPMRVIEMRKRVLGEEHPDTLISMTNLAQEYYNQKRWKETEELEIQIMAIRMRMLGKEHLDTLISMTDLAVTYCKQEQWKKAEELVKQVIETRIRMLGKEHPDTLTCIAGLAEVYWNQGRWDKTEELDMQLMETRMRLLGEEHPDTLINMTNLTATYCKQEQWKKAEELEKQVVDIKKRVLGEEHPDTLISIANLALTYWNCGRWKEAEELQIQTMKTYEKILGNKHPDTLISMANLANMWESQGRTEEAISLLKKCIEIRREVLDPDHPDTQSSLETLNKWERGDQEIES